MLGQHFRPWGLLSWILDHLPGHTWDILGCLGTEDRCLATLSEILSRRGVNTAKFFEVEDPPSQYSKEAKAKRDALKSEFERIRGRADGIELHQLFEPHSILVDSVRSFCEGSGGNVIVDISSFPKRFFFPIVRLLLTSGQISNLIATYTVPKAYHSGDLAESPEQWRHLPLFMPEAYPEPKIDVALVGIGFLPFGLPELLRDDYEGVDVKFFFPFPPGPPNYQRTWEFIRRIEKSSPLKSPQQQIVYVEAVNLSDAFNRICQETRCGQKNAIFAPYGPKPVSLAMCIYATFKHSPVYYTQPKIYHPFYSTGINMVNGMMETYAYCIRLNNNNLYSVEN